MFEHKIECYGTATVGERGQIVIPAAAREEFGLKVGDKLLVFGRGGKFMGLMRAKDFDQFIEKISAKMARGVEKLRRYGKDHRG